MRRLKYFIFITDIGFVIYWLVVFWEMIPPEYLFSNYQNPILKNWNWSFFPLDWCISALGFYSLWLYKKNKPIWRNIVLIALVLTSVSGLQAISFWWFAKDFNLTWWLPNLFLLIYPLFFIPRLIKTT